MKRLLSLAWTFAALGCAAGNPDDINDGDSADPLLSKDGYSVPSALGLDKDGVLYLTFDDGPSAALTPAVLDVLGRHGVPATFFLTGQNIAGNEALLRRMRAEGHLVANHQWVHDVASVDDFERWTLLVRDRIHEVAGEGPLLFRYPYGAMEPWKEDVLLQLGYWTGGIGWDIDTLDWDFGPDGVASRPEVPEELREDFVGFVVDRAVRAGGGVVLFHDVQSVTADNLDEIIVRLRAAGFRFGGLPERLADPLAASGCPEGWFPERVGTAGGRFCSNGLQALGPFTRTMVDRCTDWGGGAACGADTWSRPLFLSARGDGLCPDGASLDRSLGYCVEGDAALGPFDEELVGECERAGGGRACRSSRWSRPFLAALLVATGRG